MKTTNRILRALFALYTPVTMLSAFAVLICTALLVIIYTPGNGDASQGFWFSFYNHQTTTWHTVFRWYAIAVVLNTLGAILLWSARMFEPQLVHTMTAMLLLGCILFLPPAWIAFPIYVAMEWSFVIKKRHLQIGEHNHVGSNQDGLHRSEVKGNNDSDRDYPAIQPCITFRQIAGMLNIKEQLLAAGKEVFSARNSAIEPRNGIMLHGDPGNGKSMFAEALAGELGIPFISVSFGQLNSRWIGATAEHIVAAFASAKRHAPCVLFLDEIDGAMTSRDTEGSSASDDARKTTNTLLTELVDIRNHHVVVIGATNYLEQLDAAAIREKRFDYKVEIPHPDQAARRALIAAQLAKYPNLVVSESVLAIALRRWEGFSAARIRAVSEEVVRTAVSSHKYQLQYADFQAAMKRTQGSAGTRIGEATPRIEDLVMPELQRKQLQGIALRMRDIEMIESMGGSVPTGVLFWGEPGTGKTLVAQSLAKSCEWALKVVSGNDLIAKPKLLDEVHQFAKNYRPAIIFIDEADDVLRDRRNSAQHVASITSKLLTLMNGAGTNHSDIVWIAATNHPDAIDPAALRGGRFTEKIEFLAPDQATATELVRQWMNTTKAPLDATFKPDVVAVMVTGLTPGNIKAVLQQAVNVMINRCAAYNIRGNVTLNDVEIALSDIIGA